MKTSPLLLLAVCLAAVAASAAGLVVTREARRTQAALRVDRAYLIASAQERDAAHGQTEAMLEAGLRALPAGSSTSALRWALRDALRVSDPAAFVVGPAPSLDRIRLLGLGLTALPISLALALCVGAGWSMRRDAAQETPARPTRAGRPGPSTAASACARPPALSAPALPAGPRVHVEVVGSVRDAEPVADGDPAGDPADEGRQPDPAPAAVPAPAEVAGVEAHPDAVTAEAGEADGPAGDGAAAERPPFGTLFDAAEHDADTFAHLLADACDDLRDHVGALKTALRSADGVDAARHARAVRSAGWLLDAPDVCDCADTLLAAVEGGDLTGAARAFVPLHATAEAAVAEVDGSGVAEHAARATPARPSGDGSAGRAPSAAYVSRPNGRPATSPTVLRLN